MTVTAQAFIQGMRQLAAGVTLVTTAHQGRRAGLTATAVCSVSATPPQLLACLNQQAEAHDVVATGRCFAVNLLASDQQRLARIFSGATGLTGERRFEAGEWTTLKTGVPVLRRCLAVFDCVAVHAVPAATHTIFIGRVEAVTIQPELAPLVYVEGDYGLIAPLATPFGGSEGPAW